MGTPRKSSLTRSRNQSTESINRMNSLPRELYPKREPYYKVPPPNPKLVNPNDQHFYSEPLYEEDQPKITTPRQSRPQNNQKVTNGRARDNNQNIKDVLKSAKTSASKESSKKAPEKRSTKADRQDMSRRDESSGKVHPLNRIRIFLP